MHLIPCAISVLRAFTVIPILLLFSSHSTAAFVIFTAAAASDFLDGFLARKLGAESEQGKIIDPIADKILYLGSLAALRNAVPTVYLLIIPALVFEILLVAIRFIHPYCNSRAANQRGKIKTALQFCATACMMLGVISDIRLFVAFGYALGLVAVPLAWMSFRAHIFPNKTTASM